MTALAIVAPTDAQLGYIADLCRKQGHAPPQAVHSRQEATEIISAMRDGSYDAERYCPDADLPEALRPSRGTWLADDYPELPDEGEAELRYGGGEREAERDAD